MGVKTSTRDFYESLFVNKLTPKFADFVREIPQATENVSQWVADSVMPENSGQRALSESFARGSLKPLKNYALQEFPNQIRRRILNDPMFVTGFLLGDLEIPASKIRFSHVKLREAAEAPNETIVGLRDIVKNKELFKHFERYNQTTVHFVDSGTLVGNMLIGDGGGAAFNLADNELFLDKNLVKAFLDAGKHNLLEGIIVHELAHYSGRGIMRVGQDTAEHVERSFGRERGYSDLSKLQFRFMKGFYKGR